MSHKPVLEWADVTTYGRDQVDLTECALEKLCRSALDRLKKGRGKK